jgi:hypothetical protein
MGGIQNGGYAFFFHYDFSIYSGRLDQERKEREDQRREDEQKAALAQGEPRVMTTKVAKRAEVCALPLHAARSLAVLWINDGWGGRGHVLLFCVLKLLMTACYWACK